MPYSHTHKHTQLTQPTSSCTYMYMHRMKMALLVRMGEKDVLEALAAVRMLAYRMRSNAVIKSVMQK